METMEAIVKVLIVGLVLGAGLPALFAVGMRLQSTPDGAGYGGSATDAQHRVRRLLAYAIYGFVALVIITGILWITRQTIYYYTGIKIFPFGYK
ncbi:hypothetical protein GDN83_08675 [Gordonia jinghuaiqii]|uniref:Uncharacterized protein n=1 Tax=Gordonia jinghuaiqii TaxID=2758710 RepID=A0A7D7QYR1_9ACTN|nr:hypothetical protein [Gordonia jinghuaiqii]MCR5977810.1 hypothetical protein [Gordonia jinghuaiqii]QMT02469.1 hypothetical protein H1R19_04745 [Gordonia jinghuaiqii]